MIYIPIIWLNNPNNLDKAVEIIGDYFERDVLTGEERTGEDIQRDLEGIGEGHLLEKLNS